MEAWREELYHGIFSNFRSRISSVIKPTIGRISVGSQKTSYTTSSSGNSTGREWKEHKYIRKEGNRYIYPEDLKSPSKKSSSSINNTITSKTGNGVVGGNNAGSVSSKKVSTPRSRVKNITGTSSDISIKGKGLGTGHVGTGTGRNSTNTTTRSNPMTRSNQMPDNNKTTAQLIDEYLSNNSLQYYILANAIKGTGSAISKLYNSGKDYLKNLKNKPKEKKKHNRDASAASVLDGNTPVNTVNATNKVDDIPLDVLIAFNNVLDSYIEEQEKKNK